MKHLTRNSLAAVLAIVLATTAYAQNTYTFTGGPLTIPDNSAAGINMDIVVGDSFIIDQFESVSFTFGTLAQGAGNAPNRAHSWIGDLIATLTHVPSGMTIDLFRRVGSVTTSGVGDSSNLSGVYTLSNVLPLSFASTRLVDEAVLGDTTYNLRNGVYRPTTNTFPGSGSAGAGENITNLNTTFDGLNVNGTWRLFMSDNAGGDIGDLQSWSFTVVPASAVPEPATMTLAGMGLAAITARYRKRRKAATKKSGPMQAAAAAPSTASTRRRRSVFAVRQKSRV